MADTSGPEVPRVRNGIEGGEGLMLTILTIRGETTNVESDRV